MRRSTARGYNISADGSDVDRSNIIGNGKRYLKLAPYAFDLLISRGAVMIRDKNNKDCIVEQNDVDVIKEADTGRILWMSATAKQAIIELDMHARPRPVLTRAN